MALRVSYGSATRGGAPLRAHPGVLGTSREVAVYLHEFGHNLGLGHQKNYSSIMEFHGGNGVISQDDRSKIFNYYLPLFIKFDNYFKKVK